MEYLQDVFFANLNAVWRLGGFFSAPVGTRWEKNASAFEQNKFYYITKGSCSITINEKEYVAKAGQWFFIPANTSHSYHTFTNRCFEKYWIHFDLYPDSKIFELLNIDFCVRVSEKSNVNRIFEKYARICESDNLADKIETKALLINLIAEYIKLSDNKKMLVSDRGEEPLRKVLAYINENLNKSLANPELAEICHLHPTHFIRYFKDKTGYTPQAYVMRQRVEAAKRLLEQTRLGMADISEQTGMCDAAHLSKVFRRFYSISPQQYRKMYRK